MKKLIIVEGKDDEKFLTSLCQVLEINNLEVKSINPTGRGGKSRFFIADEIS